MKPPYSARPSSGKSSSGPRPGSGDQAGRGQFAAGRSGSGSEYGRPGSQGTKHGGKPSASAGRSAGSRPAPRPADTAREAAMQPGGERMTLQRRPEPAVPARPAASGPQRTRAEIEAPRGTIWLYGQHAVAAALANPARRLRRLLLTEEAEATLAGRLGQPWPLAAERSERGRLDHLLGREAIHQGVALLADPLPVPALATALARPGPVLVLDQVSDPRNVGAILRSAAAFGAACVIAQERNAPEETGALAKAASGALETTPLLRAVNIARTLIALKAAGCWTVGLDAGGTLLSGPALAGRRVALVLGAEGEGLRRLVRETCDEVAAIAMPGAQGALDSLNVSNAAAIALYELRRQP